MASRSTNLVLTPLSRHAAANFNGDLGSVEDSMTSLIPKVVPSTSLTITVSLLGPENSTTWTDMLESRSKIENSSVETMGIALAEPVHKMMAVKKAALLIRLRRVADGVQSLTACSLNGDSLVLAASDGGLGENDCANGAVRAMAKMESLISQSEVNVYHFGGVVDWSVALIAQSREHHLFWDDLY